MTSSISGVTVHHSIADIERDTGLSKDTLRVWERRYGFPQPTRDAQGERQYDDEQLTRLRHVRRLIDAGHRPGRVVSLPLTELLQLDTQERAVRMQGSSPSGRSRSRAGAPAPEPCPDIPRWLEMLVRQDVVALRQSLQQSLLERGLARMLVECVAPMNMQVGQSWIEGRLAVHQEHLYTEVVQGLLRQAMAQAATQRTLVPPRVLLTTLPGEPHALGLLMAECMLVLEGCQTVPLGTQTPLPEIVAAAQAGGADIVALGFSGIQNPREVRTALEQLRLRLPPTVALWAGGQVPLLRRDHQTGVAGWQPMGRLVDIPMGVAAWRAGQSARDGTRG
ncbi:MAG: MerR family transcriptional regulator [Hydrogenophaga sp.]|jgi:methanogenic corrinoid protein MtbC1|nr:MerR family transcriptional regulator [Hydrogenophaga sp.]